MSWWAWADHDDYLPRNDWRCAISSSRSWPRGGWHLTAVGAGCIRAAKRRPRYKYDLEKGWQIKKIGRPATSVHTGTHRHRWGWPASARRIALLWVQQERGRLNGCADPNQAEGNTTAEPLLPWGRDRPVQEESNPSMRWLDGRINGAAGSCHCFRRHPFTPFV
jgi:YD repeat-containing protein